MPGLRNIENDLLLLRSRIEDLKRMLKREPFWNITLPKEGSQAVDKGNLVEAGSVFISIMSAISKAIRKLGENRVGVDMNCEPIEIKFRAHVIKNGKEIFLKIKHEEEDKNSVT